MAKKTIYTTLKVEIPRDKILKDVIREKVQQETNYLRNTVSEQSKAIVVLQKQVKSLELKVNRLDAQKKRK